VSVALRPESVVGGVDAAPQDGGKGVEITLLSGAAGTLAIVSGTTDPERARATIARFVGV
jgi:hypothetical protein